MVTGRKQEWTREGDEVERNVEAERTGTGFRERMTKIVVGALT